MKRFFPVVSRENPSKRPKDDGSLLTDATEKSEPPENSPASAQEDRNGGGSINTIGSNEKLTSFSSAPVAAEQQSIGAEQQFRPIESDGRLTSASSAPVAAEKQITGAEQQFASIFKRGKSFEIRGQEAASTLGCEKTGKSPLSFMSWNTNSLIIRMKTNKELFVQFLEEYDPDVIAIQEVRLPAAGEKRGPKNRGEMSDITTSARDDKQFMTRALATAPFSKYRVFWSLADGKYSGTAILVKKEMEVVSVAYCFDDILQQMVTGESASLSGRKGPKHEEEGRLIMVEFPDFRLLNTYGMNNGWKEETFQRRREWDRRMLELVEAFKEGKPLIWCGDANVSHTDLDVSHPEFFRWQKEKGYTPPRDVDIGQPGFTQAEKDRFSEILEKGKLVDSYRRLHPNKEYETGFTWSGHPVGKYRGKRMRIDYFLVSEKLVDRLESSEIHGSGIERIGFMGSDHCPITMRLRPRPPEET